MFVYMLANCRPDGTFEQTPEIIAQRSGIPLDQVEIGLRVLEQPDRRSRSGTAAGRRLLRLDEHRDWGWRIVNYEHYRSLVSETMRRERDRERKRKERQAVAAQHPSTNVPRRHARSQQAEAEVEVEKKKKRGAAGKVITPEHVSKAADRFHLPLETVQLLADRIVLEAPERKYRNLPSALLNWCAREQKSALEAGDVGAPDPERRAMVERTLRANGRADGLSERG